MSINDTSTSRRNFLGTLATGAAAISVGSLATPLQSLANPYESKKYADDADAWISQIKSKKHKAVFDVTESRGIMPFAWPRIYLMTNEMTGSKPQDMAAVVVLRHEAIPYAMQDGLWSKYSFGKMFKADDPMTQQAAVRNAFYKPKADDFKVPGVGPVQIGINELQESGVLFGVCNVALTVYSAAAADAMKMNAADIKKEWEAGLLPGVKVLPSGVWGVTRAQEYGAAYVSV